MSGYVILATGKLGPAGPTGPMGPAGGVSQWQPSTAYTVGQLVWQGVTTYRVTANHTSGATFTGANLAVVGTTNHGSLSGLADDDHTQYLTSARHAAITGNPHGTTAAQVGADPAGSASSAVSTHAGVTSGVHGISAFGATLAAAADAPAARSTLGLGIAALSGNASTVARGVIEIATTTEVTTGTAADLAVTPASLAAATTVSNIHARTAVELNGTVIGTRRSINFIQGSNVTLTVADDPANEEVDVTIAATGGGGGALPVQPLLTDTTYSGIPGVAMASSSNWTTWNSIVGDRAIAGFFVVTAQLTITQAEVRVNTAGTGAAAGRLGIYNCSAAMVPTTLVADFGVVNCSTTGRKTITGLSTVLAPGFYFSYLVVNENLTFEVRTGQCPWAGLSPIAFAGQWSGWNGFVATYGALPGTAPTVTGNPNNNAAGGINIPVNFRWS